MSTESSKKQYLVLISALCFSLTGLIQAHAPTGANPFVIGAVRMVVGGLALLLWCWHKKILCFKKETWNLKLILFNLIPSVIGLVGYQVCFFEGLLHAGVAVGTVIAIGVGPVFTAILASVFYGVRPKKVWYLATGLSILGLVSINLTSLDSINIKSIFLPIASGFSYALYLVSSKNLAKDNPPEFVMMLLFCLSGLCMLPIFFLFPVGWLVSFHGLVFSLFIGVFATALAYCILLEGLKYVSSAKASTLSLAEPMGAACFGILLLGEPFNLYVGLGMLLILSGVILLTAVSKE